MSLNSRIRQFIDYKGITVQEFEIAVSLSNGAVSKMGENTRRQTIDKISNTFPDLNTDWLLTGSGNMINNADNQLALNSEQKGVPFFADLPVSAGRLDTIMQGAEPTGYVDIPGVRPTALFPVIGCSMQPEINPGDVVGVTEVSSWDRIDPDKVYMVITHEDRMIKHLATDNEDDSILWCISPNYPKFKISKSDIKYIYRISFCGKLM